MSSKLALLVGRSNQPLCNAISNELGVAPTGMDVRRFSDGEIGVEIRENVRGKDVFVIQSTSTPGNDHLMELLIIMDALRRASAKRITAVLPYFGYARQDRKTKPRVAITAKLVSDLIVCAGCHRVLTMDLHAGQVMGFFNVPVDNLYARPVFLNHINEYFYGKELTIISPDAGGVARARAYAKRLNCGLAIIDKRRSAPNEVAEMNVVGDVSGRIAIIVDDMIDTGGTMVKAADSLLDHGATEVYSLASHAVLSGNAKESLPKSNIKKLITSDSIYHADLAAQDTSSWMKKISVAPLIAEAIKRIHFDESLSILFASE